MGKEELKLACRANHKDLECIDGVGQKEEVLNAHVMKCFMTMLLEARGKSSEFEASLARRNRSGRSICVR